MNSKLTEIFGPNFSLDDIDFNQKQNNFSIFSIESLDSNNLYKALRLELELFYKERNKSMEKQTLHKNKSLE